MSSGGKWSEGIGLLAYCRQERFRLMLLSAPDRTCAASTTGQYPSRWGESRLAFVPCDYCREVQMVLDRLREAFPDQYIAVGEPVPPQAVGLRGPSSIDHRFHRNSYGATIYVRRGSPNIARIRRNALERGHLPNSAELLAYAQEEDIYLHDRGGTVMNTNSDAST